MELALWALPRKQEGLPRPGKGVRRYHSVLRLPSGCQPVMIWSAGAAGMERQLTLLPLILPSLHSMPAGQ